LDRIDCILTTSGLETEFIALAAKEHGIETKSLSHKELENFAQRAVTALRSAIARDLHQLGHRAFSRLAADSDSVRKFMHLVEIDGKKTTISKSASQRHATFLSAAALRRINDKLHAHLAAAEGAATCGLPTPVAYDDIFADCTCLEADIHHPVDWLLLRDAVRSLATSIATIRRHGLKCRLPQAPLAFLSAMNKLCIAMSAAGRTEDRKRLTKKVLRTMKKLLHRVAGHARSHLDALRTRLPETDLSQGEAQAIIRRMDNILKQLPGIIRQSHERIIGGRKVANADKILSLYDSEARVILRRKAGAAVEFGNNLWLAENRLGLIVDYQLLKENPSETSLLAPSVERLVAAMKLPVKAVFTDRGIASKSNRKLLEDNGIKSGLCPRSAPELTERMATDPAFRSGQKRRASTEGRIGILKETFGRNPLKSKGFEHREKAVGGAVLSHNLWKVAKLAQAEAAARAAKTAA
jgi:hypothetical protein